MPQINPISGQVSDATRGVSAGMNLPVDQSGSSESTSVSGTDVNLLGSSPNSSLSEYPNSLVSDSVDSNDQSAIYSEDVSPESGSDNTDSRGPTATRNPASTEEPKGAKQIKALREEGIPEADINEWRKVREDALREGGVPEEEIRAFFGDPPTPDQKPIKEAIKADPVWHPPMAIPSSQEAKPSTPEIPKETKGIWDAFEAGLEGSSAGLAWRGKLPDKEFKPSGSMLEEFAHSAGQAVGDIPFGAAAATMAGLTAGGIVGGYATAAGTPVVGIPAGAAAALGAGYFAAGAAPAAIRKLLTNSYKNGEVKTAQEFSDLFTGVLAQSMKEGVVSLVTGGAGEATGKFIGPLTSKIGNELVASTAKTGAKLGTEAATIAVAGPAMEGRLPNKEDFINSAALVAGMHTAFSAAGAASSAAKGKIIESIESRVASNISDKLQTIYEKTGLQPHEVTSMAEKDPVLHREIISGSKEVPKSLESYVETNQPKPLSSTSDYVQMDMEIPGQQELGLSGRSPKENAFKKISIPDAVPESLGGGEVQLEFSIPEQGDLFPGRTNPNLGKTGGLTTQDSFDFSKNPEFKGQLDFLPEGQRELGLSGGKGEAPKYTELPGGIAGATEQLDLNIKPGWGANMDPEYTQYDFGLGIGQYQPQLDIPYKSSPREMPPLEGFSENTDVKNIGPKKRFESITPEQLKAMSSEEASKLIGSRFRTTPKDGVLTGLSLAEIQRRVFDEYAPILRLQKQLTNSKTTEEAINAIQASSNPYLLARNNKGVVGKSIVALEHETFDYNTLKKTGQSLKEILTPYSKDAKKWESFEQFLGSARAVELSKRNIESGMPEVAALKIYEEGKSKFGKDAKKVVDFQNRILKYAVDSGVISEKDYVSMVSQGEHYVPFKRVIEGESLFSSSGSKLTVTKTGSLKEIKGSTAPIVNPIESIVRNTHDVIAMAERNRVMRSLRDLIGNNEDILTKVETEKGKTVDFDTGEKGTQFRPLRDNEIAVYDDGKRTIYEVDDMVAKAVRAMDQSTMNLLTKLFAVPASTLRAGATLAPDFLVKNVIRDQLHAFVASGNSYLPFLDYTRGLMSMIGKDEDYVNWLKGGGMSATIQSIDRNYISKNIVELSKDTGFLKTAQNVVKHPIQLLRAISEFGEQPTRLGEYKASTKGKSDINSVLKGAYDARNVTLDFQRRGANVSALNAIIPFFNANNQGLDQLRTLLTEHTGRTLLKGAIVASPAVLLWAANHNDPRYAELKDWEKKLFYIAMTDDWQPAKPEEEGLPNSRQKPDGSWEINLGKVYRIPKPQGIGMEASLLEAGLDAWKLHDPQGAENLAGAILDQFLPDVPSLPKLAAELTANHSYFRDSAIVPYFLEKELPARQYTPYTSSLAKFISQKLQDIGVDNNFIPAPAKIDYAVQSTFGGLGDYATTGISYTLEKLGYTPEDTSPKKFEQLPFVKAFTISFPQSSRSIEEFYSEFKKLDSYNVSFNAADKAGDMEAVAKISSSPEFKIADAMKSSFRRAQKDMKDIKADISAISKIPETEMPKNDKIRLIDALMWRRTQTAKAVLTELKQVRDAVEKGGSPEDAYTSEGSESGETDAQ